MNSMRNFIKIFQNLNIYMTLKKCFIFGHQNYHRLIEAGIKCLVGGADDGNLNETYIRRAIKCHHLNLPFDILSITQCDEYTHIFTLNVNVPRLIVCPTCLNSDMGRDLMTSTYAIKSVTFTMLPRVSCRDNQNVRCISAVRSNLWQNKISSTSSTATNCYCCCCCYSQATDYTISFKS